MNCLVLKADFPLLFTEQHLLDLLPESMQKFFVDNYSRFLLFVQVAKRGSRHVCTASAKFDVPCDVILADELPSLCSPDFCPWICHEDGSCVRDPAATNTTIALEESLALMRQVGGMKANDDSWQAFFEGDFARTACQVPAPLMKVLCSRIEYLFDIVTHERNISLAEAFSLSDNRPWHVRTPDLWHVGTHGDQSTPAPTTLALTSCAAMQLSAVILCSIALLVDIV